MRHNYPPRTCWCGTRHTPGQVYDLNVHGRDDLPSDDVDTLLTAEERRQRAADIAAAGGWHLLTNDEADLLSDLVDAAGGPEALTTEQAAEIFRGTGPLDENMT